MTALEIVLVIIGLILFVGSFFISEKITASSEQLKAAIDVNEVKKLIQHQINDMNEDIETAVNQIVDDSTSSVQRSMEKMSNEKIMAINEYSDTVMAAINKNHNEVMFLYGMLNDKNKEIRETADLITKANKGITKKIDDAQSIADRMDKQIGELNKFAANQKESMDRLEKSASTIEILEEQISNIEQMAMQFSKDIKSESPKKVAMNTILVHDEAARNSLAANEEDESLGETDRCEFVENDFADQKIFEEFNSEESENNGENEENIEEIFGNFSEEKVKDYNDDQEIANNNKKILSMSKEGLTTWEIAKGLGLGVGEVQLVLDLFEGGRR